MTKDYPWGKGTPKWVRDAAANDSNKSFTVPTGKIWIPKYIRSVLSTTATVGNRTQELSILDGVNYLLTYGNPNQAASSTTTTIWGMDDSESSIGGVSYVYPLPDIVLQAGFIIQISDTAAIDAAADDLTINLYYIEYDA